MLLKELVEQKGRDVITVPEQVSICEASRKMVEDNIGSILVINDEEAILGILTERDLLKLCPQRYHDMGTILVRDVMTRDVIVANTGDSLDVAEKLMTKNRIRHLPVLDQGKIAGLLSIGDIVKVKLDDLEVENRYLKDYISGNYTS